MRKLFAIGISLVLAATAMAKPEKSLIAANQTEIGDTTLPYDAEVEYIGGNGKPYINTGIHLRSTDLVSLDLYVASNNTNAWWGFFGAYDGQRYLVMRSYRDKPSYFNFTNPNRAVLGNRFEWNNYIHSFGGKIYESAVECYLFTYNNNGTPYYSIASRIASFTIVRDGVRILDYVPVRFTNELGESEGAMYDKVSGELFRNQGGGAFVIGSDVE